MHMKLLLLHCLLCISAISHADWQPYVLLETNNYATTGSIENLQQGLKKSYQPGQLAFSLARYSSGIFVNTGQQSYSLGYLYRDDYFLTFSKDTARLLHDINSQQNFDTPQDYQISLQAKHLRAEGLQLTLQQDIAALQIYASLSLLRADQITEGNISGHVSSTDGNSYNGNIDINDIYQKDPLFARHTSRQYGYGYSLDFTMRYRSTLGTQLSYKVQDVSSLIQWQNAPYTKATLTNAQAYFDNEGILHKPASLNGFEGYKTHNQYLPAMHALKIEQTVEDFNLQARWDINSYYHNLAAQVGYQLAGQKVVFAGYQSFFHSPYLGLNTQNWQLELSAQRWPLKENQHVLFNIRYLPQGSLMGN